MTAHLILNSLAFPTEFVKRSFNKWKKKDKEDSGHDVTIWRLVATLFTIDAEK